MQFIVSALAAIRLDRLSQLLLKFYCSVGSGSLHRVWLISPKSLRNDLTWSPKALGPCNAAAACQWMWTLRSVS